MWVLIGILITGGDSFESQELGRFDDMIECFYVREQVVNAAGGKDGTPPINTQFVCIPTEYK